MKLALISGIHANLEAIEAAFAAIARHSVDRIICLGDIVGYNTRPTQCIALIRSAHCVCVAGNHDLAVSGRIGTRNFDTRAARAVAWTRRSLEANELNFLRGLPLKANVHNAVVAVHGALHPQTGGASVRLDSDERRMLSFRALIADPSRARICAFGHTRHAAVYELRHGRVSQRREDEIALHDDAYYLINPGTIGRPRRIERRASYMILDLARHTVAVHRVAYDASVPQAATHDAGLAPRFGFMPAPFRSAIASGLRALFGAPDVSYP